MADSTVLWFHRATTSLGTAVMRGAYPSGIRLWADRHHALDSDALTPMSGEDAIRLGARALLI